MSRKPSRIDVPAELIGVAVLFLGGYGCFALGQQYNDLSKLLSNTNGRFILEILIVTGIVIVENVLASTTHIRYPKSNSLDNQPAFLKLFRGFVLAFSQICLICYIALNQPKGLAAIGLGQLTESSLTSYLLGGSLLSLCFLLLYAVGYRIIHGKKQIDAKFFLHLASYRTFWERLGFLVMLLISAIAEELVYRGYLVLLLGERVNAVLICALISVVLSVVGHLYQGRSSIVFHILFAFLAIAVTIWTGSIIMAIAMHIYNNVIMAIGSWSHIDKQAAQQRIEQIAPVDTR